MKKIIPFLIFLTSCSTVSKKQSQLNADYFAECQYGDPELDPIRNKVAFLFTGVQHTKAMRENKDYVSSSEEPVIKLWIKKRNDCNKHEHNMLLLRNKQVVDNLINLLLRGKITYGEFTKYREDVAQLALDIEAVEAAISRNSMLCPK